MKKQEYMEKVLQPLMQEFGYPIYFNGMKAEAIGYKVSSNASGGSYTKKTHKPIVLTWQRDFMDTVQTTVHEIGHSALHGKGSGFQCGKSLKEIEAEMVAKRAFELLDLPYRSGFTRRKDLNYIEHFKNKYRANCEAVGAIPKEPRVDKVEEVAQRIYKVLKNVKI